MPDDARALSWEGFIRSAVPRADDFEIIMSLDLHEADLVEVEAAIRENRPTPTQDAVALPAQPFPAALGARAEAPACCRNTRERRTEDEPPVPIDP